MVLVNFPEIEVDIKHGTPRFDKRDTFDKLGITKTELNTALLVDLTIGISLTKVFSGATIDHYAHTIKEGSSYNAVSDDDIVRVFIEEFAGQNLVHSVVCEPTNLNREIEALLLTKEDIQRFLVTEGGYDAETVKRTIFVPSPVLTQIFWGFEYETKGLEHLVEMQPFLPQ